jgi:hypothetical protein
MNKITIILCLCISHAVFSQNWIKLKDKKLIKNIELWEIQDSSIVYEQGGTLHDLSAKSIVKVVTHQKLIVPDEYQRLHSIPYDSILLLKGDTIKCIITSEEWNKIYYTILSDFKEFDGVIDYKRIKRYIRQGVKSPTTGSKSNLSEHDTIKNIVTTPVHHINAKQNTPFCFFYNAMTRSFSLCLVDELNLELGLEVKLFPKVGVYEDVGFMVYNEGYTSTTGIKIYVFSRAYGKNKKGLVRLFCSPHFAYRHGKYSDWDNNGNVLKRNDHAQVVNFTFGSQIVLGSKFTLEISTGVGTTFFKTIDEYETNMLCNMKLGFSF